MPIPPLVDPADALPDDERARTARHRALAGFGDEAQRRLAAAHVAVIGAGGLGSPAVLALAAAGVGTLTVIDDDVVELSNLQRQILHRVSDVGALKVASAVRVAAELSPHTTVHALTERLSPANAVALLTGVDLVIDGSDTFETREAVAEACEELHVPLVWGVVQEFHAQVTVFWSDPPAGTPAVRLADLYPPDSTGDVPTCAQVGVLGSLCLQVGGILATQAIALLTGVGDPLLGRLLVIDALRSRFAEVPLGPTRAPAHAVSRDEAASPVRQVDSLATRDARDAGAILLDVREPHETAAGVIPGSVVIPLADVLGDPALVRGHLPEADHTASIADPAVVVICRVGVRAQRAAVALGAAGITASVLAGGIEAWDGATIPHAIGATA